MILLVLTYRIDLSTCKLNLNSLVLQSAEENWKTPKILKNIYQTSYCFSCRKNTCIMLGRAGFLSKASQCCHYSPCLQRLSLSELLAHCHNTTSIRGWERPPNLDINIMLGNQWGCMAFPQENVFSYVTFPLSFIVGLLGVLGSVYTGACVVKTGKIASFYSNSMI